jgi:type VI protein secretion system component Hcp
LDPKTTKTEFFPFNATTGTADPGIAVTWDQTKAATTGETTTGNPSFGGFQFQPSAIPALMVEIGGVGKSQFEAENYSWSLSNPVQQLVGTTANPQTVAPRTFASAKDFSITTAWDRATPALINAIGQKTKLPEIRITERANVIVNGSTVFRPVREWILTDVYVTSFGTNPSIDNRTGPVTFNFDAGKVTSNVLAYSKSGSPVSRGKTVDFEAPPTVSPLAPVAAVSTGDTRFIPLPPRVINSLQAPATLRYSASVVSGGNVFTQVTVNTQNTLVLDYKPGSSGVAQVRVEVANDFGVATSVLMTVAVDADGVMREPAGTNKTATFLEDTAYVIDTADFGFSDPNDFPANAMDGVRITTLPGKGSLLLNNVPVTIGQNIPVASLNANQLRYQPELNDQGTNYTSFTFQVQDKGATSNLDLSPNVFTFNVINDNDAPTFPNSTTVVSMPDVTEDSSSHNGMLVSSIVSVITDIDPGAVKGIAVVDAPTAIGTWQFSLDNGTTWRSLVGAHPENTRLLAANATTRVRFLPNANAVGASLLRFRAWDQTAGSAGGLGSLTDFAGTGTFSSTNANLSVQVVAVNDAPVLSTVPPALPLIDEDPVYTPGPTSGVPISALVGGITDVDSGAQKGIGVIEVSTSNGQWQYSLTNGESWVNFSPLSVTTARLIRNDSSNRIPRPIGFDSCPTRISAGKLA